MPMLDHTSHSNKGIAMNVVTFLTTVGLFIGQPSAFIDLLRDLAQDADQARRER
jgi:hypothetical protein